MCKNSLHFYDLYVVAEDDNLQIFQNYEKLKKQIKTVWKRFRLKFDFKYKYFFSLDLIWI